LWGACGEHDDQKDLQQMVEDWNHLVKAQLSHHRLAIIIPLYLCLAEIFLLGLLFEDISRVIRGEIDFQRQYFSMSSPSVPHWGKL
jgi:hypothetical protein